MSFSAERPIGGLRFPSIPGTLLARSPAKPFNPSDREPMMDIRIAIRTALAMAAVVVVAGCPGAGERVGLGQDLDWDTPEAIVTQNTHTGAPAEGAALSSLPYLARLEPGTRTHDVRLDVVVSDIEVADGVRFAAWTFGGSVPGPVLHVREGDRVRFTMANRSDEEVQVTDPLRGGGSLNLPVHATLQQPRPASEPVAHSMDFHSGTVAADDKWRSIAPGQSIYFEWVANYPGVYLYHCGTPPVLMHMGMGQYGVVVVSPAGGFPTDGDVDREYVVIQSEFYLTEGADGLRAFDFQAAQNRMPTIVAFNGHQASMVRQPLYAEPGERVRLYLLNAGPTGTWSAHVIGAIFDHVYYEGTPANHWQAMQTVLLGASNGAVAEFIIPEAGQYVLVDHEMADAYLGAYGYITTTPADPVRLDAAH
jgi:nitrite reductase (NO-forming)